MAQGDSEDYSRYNFRFNGNDVGGLANIMKV